MIVRNALSHQEIAKNIKVAKHFFSRLKGLLGTKQLNPGDGLLIPKCQGVHTFGMAYAIDVIFLDRAHKIIRLIENMIPGKMSPAEWSAASVLELPAGEIKKQSLQCGDSLLFADPSEAGHL